MRSRRGNAKGKSTISKFRNATINQTPYEHWYYDIGVIDEEPIFGSFISSSSQLIAHASGKNAIAVYPLKFFEKNNNLKLNPTNKKNFKQKSPTQYLNHEGGNPILGLTFSPKETFNQQEYDNLESSTGFIEYKSSQTVTELCSYSSDKVCVQRINSEIDVSNQSLEIKVDEIFNTDTKNVRSVKYNKAAHSLLSLCDENVVKLFDLETKTNFSSTTLDDNVSSFAWLNNSTTKLGVSVLDNKSIHVTDFRTNSSNLSVENIFGGSGQVVLESSSKWIFTAGFVKGRKKEMKVWDHRNFKAPCSVVNVDNNPGKLYFNLDDDSGLIHMIAKGDTMIQVIDTNNADGSMHNVDKRAVSRKQCVSSCLVPKSALDIYYAEVNRVLVLNKDSVESVRIEVPRKRKNMFYPELFPNTVNPTKCLSVEEWKQKDDISIEKEDVSLLYKLKNGILAHENTIANNQKKKVVQKAKKKKRELESLRAVEMERTQIVYEKKTKMIGYIPKYKNIISKSPKLADSYYGLIDTNESVFTANEKYFGTTLKFTNDIYIRPLLEKGKIEHPFPKEYLLSGHKAKVSILKFNYFNSDELVSGSIDGSIKVWLNKSCTKTFTNHQNTVSTLVFHPTVADLLLSCSTAHDISLVDLKSENCSSLLETNKTLEELQKEKINDVCFNFNGTAIIVLTGTNNVVSYKLKPTTKQTFELQKEHIVETKLSKASAAVIRCVSESGIFLVSGFAPKSGKRQVKSVLITAKKGICNKTLNLSNGSSIFIPHVVQVSNSFFLTAKGEHTVKVFELQMLKENVEFHKCSDVSPTSKVAPFMSTNLPYRSNSTKAFEVGNIVQYFGTKVEVLKLIIPRAQQVKDTFADDLYPDDEIISSTPAFTSIGEFIKCIETKSEIDVSRIETLNTEKLPLYSKRVTQIRSVRKSNVLENRSRRVKQQQKIEEEEKDKNNSMMNKLTKVARNKRNYDEERQVDNLGLDEDDEWSS